MLKIENFLYRGVLRAHCEVLGWFVVIENFVDIGVLSAYIVNALVNGGDGEVS
jgi:hypothetical protein